MTVRQVVSGDVLSVLREGFEEVGQRGDFGEFDRW